jgi:hypothetical protein
LSKDFALKGLGFFVQNLVEQLILIATHLHVLKQQAYTVFVDGLSLDANGQLGRMSVGLDLRRMCDFSLSSLAQNWHVY